MDIRVLRQQTVQHRRACTRKANDNQWTPHWAVENSRFAFDSLLQQQPIFESAQRFDMEAVAANQSLRLIFYKRMTKRLKARPEIFSAPVVETCLPFGSGAQ